MLLWIATYSFAFVVLSLVSFILHVFIEHLVDSLLKHSYSVEQKVVNSVTFPPSNTLLLMLHWQRRN